MRSSVLFLVVVAANLSHGDRARPVSMKIGIRVINFIVTSVVVVWFGFPCF